MSFVLIKLDLSKMFHIALSVRCVHSYSMPPAQPTRWCSPNLIISDFVKMHMNSNIDHEFPVPLSLSGVQGGAWGTAHTPRDFLWGAVPPFFGRGLPPPINTFLSPLKIKCALRHNAKYYCPMPIPRQKQMCTLCTVFFFWLGG